MTLARFFVFRDHAMKQEEFMTLREAAQLLRASPKTVRSWVRSGLLPPVFRIGKKRLFEASELSRALCELKDRLARREGIRGR